MAIEDVGCRLGKEIAGLTSPVAKSGNAPPDPIDGTCCCAGSVGKNGGTNSLGAAAGTPEKVCKARGNRGLVPTKPEFSRGGGAAKTNTWKQTKTQPPGRSC